VKSKNKRGDAEFMNNPGYPGAFTTSTPPRLSFDSDDLGWRPRACSRHNCTMGDLRAKWLGAAVCVSLLVATAGCGTNGDHGAPAREVKRPASAATPSFRDVPAKAPPGTEARNTHRETGPPANDCDSGYWAACVIDGRRLLAKDQEREAATKFARACGARHAPACGELGLLYQQGRGLEADMPRARELYQTACEGGYGRACSQLGALYLRGLGVPPDRALAMAYTDEGCNRGDGLGCVNLALMYQRGDGVRPDAKRAAELFRTACHAGEPSGCRHLGEAYASGRGVVPHTKLAASYNIRACLKGDAPGCGNAGVNYQLGVGVRANPARAAEYFGRACDAGEERYCQLLERFKRSEEAARVATVDGKP
ncbi:MAG: tetratricopeptide repeat protein, partial [Myxococcales bacterium]|nr:tetratricopeptide repeat protein [Myxococcales bacterium]